MMNEKLSSTVEKIYSQVKTEMIGRPGINEEEAELLMKTIWLAGSGDYIEIGTLWGGSIVIAALIYRKYSLNGRLFTIDPMNTLYWGSGDPSADFMSVNLESLLENLRHFNLMNTVVLIQADSKTCPLPSIQPNIIFIDGDHSFDGVTADWKYAADTSKKYILLHDYENGHSGIDKMINTVVLEFPNWKRDSQVRSMIRFRRCNG